MPRKQSNALRGCLAAALVLALAACDRDKGESSTSEGSASSSSSSSEGSSSSGGGALQWYSTCGDPVCMSYNGPYDGVPACGAAQTEGGACDMEGAQCDFMSDCNAVLVCATSDPKLQVGGCPISRARFKEGIEYIDADARARYYRDLRALRLATYRYRGATAPREHLGVILEDREDGVWVDGAHDRVDLYSYASLAIAGVQLQADEVDALRGEVAALKAELAALRAGRCE